MLASLEISYVIIGSRVPTVILFYFLNHRQLLRILERQGPEQHTVHQAEDSGVRADPKTERDNRDRGKAFVFEKHAQSVANILQECVHCEVRALIGSSRAARRAGM